ncbi:MAG: patatin family protein [Lachnospiraceae bacterium]|nr:patatin family protein [Lachnospiraceae bacterium]
MLGIIDVGGGLRGIYGAGILDHCLDKGIEFDYCCGVSAGSANLCSYIARQKKRNYRSYMCYAFRREYMSFGNFIRTGSYLDLDYVFGTLCVHDGEDPMDYETFSASGKIFYTVATDAKTGETRYFEKTDYKYDDFTPVKCSSCVPAVNKPYPFENRLYYDGGLSDPIPVKKALSDGCDKLVIVLTRPKNYYRSPSKDRKVALLLKKKFPKAAAALQNRSRIYNQSLDLALSEERKGRVLILAPDDIKGLSTLTRDKEKLEELYQKGLNDAKRLEDFI